jgi:hypothetical protein
MVARIVTLAAYVLSWIARRSVLIKDMVMPYATNARWHAVYSIAVVLV